jgi:hypothetical protein
MQHLVIEELQSNVETETLRTEDPEAKSIELTQTQELIQNAIDDAVFAGDLKVATDCLVESDPSCKVAFESFVRLSERYGRVVTRPRDASDLSEHKRLAKEGLGEFIDDVWTRLIGWIKKLISVLKNYFSERAKRDDEMLDKTNKYFIEIRKALDAGNAKAASDIFYENSEFCKFFGIKSYEFDFTTFLEEQMHRDAQFRVEPDVLNSAQKTNIIDLLPKAQTPDDLVQKWGDGLLSAMCFNRESNDPSRCSNMGPFGISAKIKSEGVLQKDCVKTADVFMEYVRSLKITIEMPSISGTVEKVALVDPEAIKQAVDVIRKALPIEKQRRKIVSDLEKILFETESSVRRAHSGKNTSAELKKLSSVYIHAMFDQLITLERASSVTFYKANRYMLSYIGWAISEYGKMK